MLDKLNIFNIFDNVKNFKAKNNATHDLVHFIAHRYFNDIRYGKKESIIFNQEIESFIDSIDKSFNVEHILKSAIRILSTIENYRILLCEEKIIVTK